MNAAEPTEEPGKTSAADKPFAIQNGLQIRYRVVWFIVVIAVSSVYLLLTESGWGKFEWKHDLDGYYDSIGRAFLSGHVRFPEEPRAELLALKDPWDPRFNVPYRRLDLALYNGHYYLYHGPAPALLFFAPWRLLTGHDLPESFVVFVLCLVGFLVLCELLMSVLSTLPARVPLWMFALFLLTLAFGESLPYLLQRALVYEVAVASGFLFVSCGFFALFKATTSVRRRIPWLYICGTCFGVAAGCRPYLVLAIVPALVAVTRLNGRPFRLSALFNRELNREVIALVLPAAMFCLCIAGYNYARFGNPLEFGLRYLMANPEYQNIQPALVNIFPSLYYFLVAPPAMDPVFPFVSLTFRVPFESLGYHLPARYFNEGTGGIVVLCPLVLLAIAPAFLVAKRSRCVAILTARAMTAYSLLCILFVASLGLLSQRYELDFQPYLLLAGCILTALAIGLMHGRKRILANIALASIMAWSIFANMALAVQGPYDQLVQAHPASYFKLARWFSPIERFRPLVNPPVHVYGHFYFRFPCDPSNGPLISIGDFAERYLVSEVCTQYNQVRIISSFGEPRYSQVRFVDLPLERAGFKRVDVDFSPQDRHMTVRWNGTVVLTHQLPFLFVARSHVRVGWDASFGLRTEFAGRFIVPVTPAP